MNSTVLDALLVLVLLLNLFALGTSRIRAVIQAAMLQGILLGVMPLFAHPHAGLGTLLLCAATVAVKGGLIPMLLLRAIRELDIRRDVEAVVGLTGSLVLGAAGTGAALYLSTRLPLADVHAGTLLVPTALATVFTGFLLLVARLKAVTQVVGYLVLENGVFIFGLLLLEAMPFLVEVGVLLDLFVGIFIMGIMLNHIRREFASLSTEHLATLKE